MNKTKKSKQPRKQTKKSKQIKQTKKSKQTKQIKQEVRNTFKRKRSYRPRMKRYIKLSSRRIPTSVKLGSMEEQISVNTVGQYIENKKI